MSVRLRRSTGRSFLSAMVQLLRRVRLAHPTAGVWEAADLEWWWRTPRASDDWDQLVWHDDCGPVAAASLTAWRSAVGLDVVTLPGSSPDHTAEVFWAGLERAGGLGVDHLEVMVDEADSVMRSLLRTAGFAPTPERGTAAWMSARARPDVTPLADGYRLVTRADRREVEHHVARRAGSDVEHRLNQTSMYRPNLDLAIVDESNTVAADALFWLDPVTGVGFVEPLGTEEAHRRRGLARHLLTVGLDRLAQLGASRLKVNYENDNPASGALYLDTGFVPVMTTAIYARSTTRPMSL